MREPADAGHIQRFMQALGRVATADGTCYLTGGATAVLHGWRAATLDVDIALDPEQDEVLRALPALKEELRINVELASPRDFIPLPDGWAERSIFVAREGRLTFRHFDPYSQVLAKLERGHTQDVEDVHSMLASGLVEPERLRTYFDEIELELYRFPAVDPKSFRRAVDEALGQAPA
ncbi:MAG: DUF6036 family nucleotidyltransferase [Gaiellaceae bacterium]